MSIFFTRLKVGYPEPQKAPDDWEGCWKIYTVCRTIKPMSCTTRADVALLDPNDKLDARKSYITFLNKAHTGQPLSALYDEKQCHETHLFKWKEHDNHEEKIYRIWGSGDIRVNFIYLPEKRIALLKTWAKRKDKLTNGEKLVLEELAREVLGTFESYNFETREI